jgi:hypothetical protein
MNIERKQKKNISKPDEQKIHLRKRKRRKSDGKVRSNLPSFKREKMAIKNRIKIIEYYTHLRRDLAKPPSLLVSSSYIKSNYINTWLLCYSPIVSITWPNTKIEEISSPSAHNTQKKIKL